VKFLNLLENAVKSINLQKVRIKVDEAPQETEKVSKFNGSRLSVFKKHLVEKLKELGKDLEAADVQQAISSNDISFIETYLKQMGLNDEDILNLYRKTLQK